MAATTPTEPTDLGHTYGPSVGRLVAVIQELSLTRDLESVMRIVRHAARALTGSDGATFVLRDEGRCYYADEDAISPLWKGSRFPMSACISGWTMLNRQAVVIEDIYADPRIPADAYRPTFVKSLAMVPIRTADPIGAIGIYWARRRLPEPSEVDLLQALADSTSIAMENVQLYADLERRVRERTAELEAVNRELEAFSYTVSHDLRGPLQVVLGFSQLLLAGSAAGGLDEGALRKLRRISTSALQMEALIRDLLKLSQVQRADLRREPTDLSELAREVSQELHVSEPEREVEFVVQDGVVVDGDAGLLRVVLDNLLGNAWKFTRKRPAARIEFGVEGDPRSGRTFFVRDNGAGFDMEHSKRLFGAFQRLHSRDEFPGTGVGLATVQRIVGRHGGRVWAEGAVGEGACFRFTLS